MRGRNQAGQRRAIHAKRRYTKETAFEEYRNLRDEGFTEEHYSEGRLTHVGLKRGISFKDFKSYHPEYRRSDLVNLFDKVEDSKPLRGEIDEFDRHG